MENETTKSVESPHSVKMSINAKGNWSGEVKCYGSSPEDAMKKTMALAVSLEAMIKQKNQI